MATFRMTPEDTTSNDWTVAVAPNAHQALASDDTDSYIHDNANDAECIVTLTDPSVAEGDIASITNYKVYVKGHVHYRGTSGSDVVTTVDGTASTDNFPNRSGPVTITTHTVSSPDYGDLAGLTLTIAKTDTETPKIVYAFIEVTYTAAAVAEDNAIFFGTNF